MKHAQQR